jgi:hypothetical protein
VTDAQILEALKGVERALKHASDAERWANSGVVDDKSGVAVRARASAQKAQRELGEVRKILKARIREAVA